MNEIPLRLSWLTGGSFMLLRFLSQSSISSFISEESFLGVGVKLTNRSSSTADIFKVELKNVYLFLNRIQHFKNSKNLYAETKITLLQLRLTTVNGNKTN